MTKTCIIAEQFAHQQPLSEGPANLAELLGVRPLDPNGNCRDREALIFAKHFLDLPERDLHQAIAYLLATNQERDLDKAALKARLHSLES